MTVKSRVYVIPENVIVIEEPQIGYVRNIFIGAITEVTQLIPETNVYEEGKPKMKTAFVRIGSKEIVPFDGELYAEALSIWLQYLRGDDFSNES